MQENIQNLPLARAYVPMQGWCGTYPPEEALRKGTIFPCLYQPYEWGEQRG